MIRILSGRHPGQPAASPQMPARHIPAASDGVLCRARVGKGGVRSPKDRTGRNRPGLAPSFAGRRPTCARKAHVSLTGGARVNAPSHIFHTTTGPSPAPHRSGLLPDKKMPQTDGEDFSRAGFWCVRSPSPSASMHPASPYADLLSSPTRGEERVERVRRFDLSHCGRGSYFSILAQAKC